MRSSSSSCALPRKGGRTCPRSGGKASRAARRALPERVDGLAGATGQVPQWLQVGQGWFLQATCVTLRGGHYTCDRPSAGKRWRMPGGRTFQSPPPKRGACDSTTYSAEAEEAGAPVSIPSAEAGGVRLDGWGLKPEIGPWVVSIPSAEAGGVRPRPRPPRRPPRPRRSFNPLRRSGGRATRVRRHHRRGRQRLVSIPSAEAGGVRPIS